MITPLLLLITTVHLVAAKAAFAGYAPFTATMAAPEALSSGARGEIQSRGTGASVIAPGTTGSEVWPAEVLFERSRRCRADNIAYAVRTPAEAQVALAAIDRPARHPKASLGFLHR